MAIKRVNKISSKGKPYHYYMIDGRKADGVTTLINGGLPKPALPYWSAKSVAEYVADNLKDAPLWDARSRDDLVDELKGVPWAQRDAAAAKGTEVHGIAEKLIHGDEVEVPEHIVGHVDSCVRFLDEWKIQPHLVEATVASRQWNYAGTFDFIGDLPDGRRCLFDYKTSRSGIYPETALQLAAYTHAEAHLDVEGQEQPMPTVDAAYAVWIRPDGYSVYRMDVSEPVYRAFLHVAYVARKAKEMKDWMQEVTA